jgi:hypothetical protein
MTYNNYLPPEDEKLVGIYKVSFEIHVESQDEISLSDLTQDLTEGFQRGFEGDFVSKVASLRVDKVSHTPEKESVKIGDRIRLINDISLEAQVYTDDGYVFIGNPNEISEKLTTDAVSIKVSAGSIGFVNKINKDGSLEIADLDRPYVNAAWIDAGIDAVNVDLITVNADHIEKLDSDEVN